MLPQFISQAFIFIEFYKIFSNYNWNFCHETGSLWECLQNWLNKHFNFTYIPLDKDIVAFWCHIFLQTKCDHHYMLNQDILLRMTEMCHLEAQMHLHSDPSLCMWYHDLSDKDCWIFIKFEKKSKVLNLFLQHLQL